MSLLNAIENLQQASVGKRKAVLAVSVSILMGFVIGIWVLQLRYPDAAEGSTASIKTPFALIWNSALENIKSGFGGQK
jgi:hypothetical protein